MAFVIADRVRESSTTTGTGNFTLDGAVTGYQTFDAVLDSGDTTYYTIADQGGADWEVGIGTFTSPSTLARTTVLSSSNSGSLVTFTSGTKDVFISLPASKTVQSFSAGTTGLTPSTATFGPITLAGTLAVANGGTGTATAFTAGSVVFAGASGVYSQDNANLFWDDANNRLGIGTATPSNALDVTGTVGITTNLAFSGTGNRITGDFSNATQTNRIFFQTTTSGGGTSVGAIPNATGANSAFNAFGSPDPTNSSYFQLRAGSDSSDARLTSGITGTGTYLPMTFYTGGSERARIDTSGNVGIGTTNPAGYRVRIVGASGVPQFRAGTDTGSYLEMNGYDSNPFYCVVGGSSVTSGVFGTQANIPTVFFTNNTERARIDTSGNALINTTTAVSKLTVNGDVAGTFFVNPATVSANYTIPTNYNAMTAGPISINSGITVTVPSGSTWVVA